MNRLSLFLGALTTVSQSVTLSVNAVTPIASGNECDAALSTAKTKLLKIKNLKIVGVIKSDVRQWVYEQEIPKGRSENIAFHLRGDGAKNFMSSRKLMKAVSTNLIANCESTASVSFGYAGTDGGHTYGIFQDGTIQAFKCVPPQEGKPGTKSEWGTQGCI